MQNFLNKTFVLLGAQRFLLALLSFVFVVLSFFADTSLPPHGWDIILSIVVPAMPPLLFMVYGLDLLMSRVWRSEFGTEQVARFDTIAIFDMVMMALLAIVWLPVFLRN